MSNLVISVSVSIVFTTAVVAVFMMFTVLIGQHYQV